MPKAVWNKVKAGAEQVEAKAEVRADTFLEKLKKSKRTALMLAGALAVALLLLLK